MKQILLFLCVVALFLVTSPSANAAMTFFDFEPNGAANLNAYMDGIFGDNVTTDDFLWLHSPALGDRVVFTQGAASIFDFHPVASGLAADFEITSLQFTWLVSDPTPGVDFGLDVYDDVTGWYHNVFSVTTPAVGKYWGDTGLLVFPDAWEVTRLRVHDSGTFDVGMNDLRLYDNRPVPIPEPSSMLLLGMSFLALIGIGYQHKRHAA